MIAKFLEQTQEFTREPEVLVVEDDDALRDSFVAAIEDQGWKVREARNGQEALDLARKHRPFVLLLDLKMPVKDVATPSSTRPPHPGRSASSTSPPEPAGRAQAAAKAPARGPRPARRCRRGAELGLPALRVELRREPFVLRVMAACGEATLIEVVAGDGPTKESQAQPRRQGLAPTLA